MKITILFICIFAITGCFENEKPVSKTSSDLSSQECENIGGRIVNGMGCIQDIPKDEMKKMCENNNMKYSEELHGCIK